MQMWAATGGSVECKIAGDHTQRARLALMALIVNCGEYVCQKEPREKKQTGKQKEETKWEYVKCEWSQASGFFVSSKVLTVWRFLGLCVAGRVGVMFRAI